MGRRLGEVATGLQLSARPLPGREGGQGCLLMGPHSLHIHQP